MPTYSEGLNAGVSVKGNTIISLVVNPGDPAQAYNFQVIGHPGGLTYPSINRIGRGSYGAANIRQNDPEGSGKLQLKYQVGQYPAPDQMKFATGVMTYAMATTDGTNPTCSVSFPVRITNLSWNPHAEQTKEGPPNTLEWYGSCTWELAGAVTWLWNGKQINILVPRGPWDPNYTYHKNDVVSYVYSSVTTNYIAGSTNTNANPHSGGPWTVTLASAGDQVQTYEGLTKDYDPNSLTTRATVRWDVNGIADTDSAEIAMIGLLISLTTTPPTGVFDSGYPTAMQFVDSRMMKTDSDGIACIQTYAMNNSVTAVTAPQISSWRSAQQPYTDSLATVISLQDGSGGFYTVAQVADINWATVQGQDFGYGTRVTEMNPFRALVVSEYINPGIIVRGQTSGGNRYVPYKQIGDGSEDSPYGYEVYLTEVRAVGSTPQYFATHTSMMLSQMPVRYFTLIEMISGAVTGNTIPDHPELVGLLNEAEFLGLNVGSCQYLGAIYNVNITLSGTLQTFMFYNFYNDPNGIVNFISAQDRAFTTNVDLSSAVPAGYFTLVQVGSSVVYNLNGSDPSGNGVRIEQNTGGDFSVFLP